MTLRTGDRARRQSPEQHDARQRGRRNLVTPASGLCDGDQCAAAGLVAGEAQLRVLLDNIPARVALLDRQRRHCYVNQEYAAYVGLPPEQILGRTVIEFLGMRPYAALHGFGERALAGEASNWEGWVPHHGTGEPRFVRRYYVPYRGADGTVDGYFT